MLRLQNNPEALTPIEMLVVEKGKLFRASPRVPPAPVCGARLSQPQHAHIASGGVINLESSACFQPAAGETPALRQNVRQASGP